MLVKVEDWLVKDNVIYLQIYTSNIPTSNIRLIPVHHGERWTLSIPYRRVKEGIEKEVKSLGIKLSITDWSAGYLFIEFFRRSKELFTRDLDNFLKIILDGVFTGLGLNDKILRSLEVYLQEREPEVVNEDKRKKIYGARFYLYLLFFSLEELDGYLMEVKNSLNKLKEEICN